MNREAMSKQDVFWILSCFLGLSLPEDPANQLCVQRQPANPAGRYRLCLACVARSTVGPRVRCCFRRALVWNFGFKILAPLLNFGFCNLCRDHRLCWAASCLWPLVRCRRLQMFLLVSGNIKRLCTYKTRSQTDRQTGSQPGRQTYLQVAYLGTDILTYRT